MNDTPSRDEATFGAQNTLATGRTGPTGSTPDQCFGDYELLEEIARGGMGVVYKARQRSLNRIVALKMLLGGQLASEADIRRFHKEAEAAANLDHPGIVPIHEVGQHQGLHFFSMGFIEGESLAARIARGPLEPRRAAEIVTAVAEAVQYAHERGVIHRDLKPANILLDYAGHPRVTDFGLARRVQAERDLTASGQILGTPSFMPPEQAAGRLHEVGPLSDVYALGAVLYALVTGRPPFPATNPLDTLRQVTDEEPVAPRRLNRHIPKDLETICLKAMDKRPDRRYPSAGEMAADLQRHLGGFAILARRVGPLGRISRWARRSRAVAVALLCLVVLGAVAALFAYQSYIAHKRLREQAIDAVLVAARSGDFPQAEQALERAAALGASPGWLEMLRGQVAFHRNETQEAVACLQRAVRLLPDSPAARGMLAVAYWQNGQWEKCEETQKDLERLTPVTPEDFLFKGYAEASFDPPVGLQSIDEAIRRRNSTIARSLRAEVSSWLAHDKSDAAAVEQAREDARIIKGKLAGESIGPLVSLYANLVAAVTYADKDPPKRQAALDEARKDFENLAAFPESGWARLIRYRYLEFTGDENAAYQEMREAVSVVKGPWPRTYHALGLYRRGEFQQALGELAKLEEENELGAFQATMRMYILAELLAEQLPDRRQQALQAYREELRRHQGTTLLFQLTAFYLWGRKAEAVAAYQQLPPDTLPRLRGDSYRQLLKYNCDPLMTADELLAGSGDSRYHRCNAHFFIAMSLLAQGDKQGAREHFRRCVDTGAFDFDAYDWSRTFLARMARESDWPRWLPTHRP
jgi:tRNA A-37 threonylcarbamoyl transferase component Bud32